MSFEPATPDPWIRLRQLTSARLALGRSGGSLPTRAVLDFSLDHALAQDAVHVAFDAEGLAENLRALSSEVLLLKSAAANRAIYLQRPDLGRRLSDKSAAVLDELAPSARPPDLVIVVSDGLSALAAQRQAPPLLAALLPLLRKNAFTLAPICVTQHARVALIDHVGGKFRAHIGLILLGERPGLGTPDSLGAYFVYQPGAGRTDAERNCVSNIRPEGLSPERAAEKLAALLAVARSRRLSGVGLKDDDATLEAAVTPPRVT
jgi:ethanolamine ammonia-lyase small subunit